MHSCLTVLGCIQDLEEEADKLQANIETGHKDKSHLLTDIVDTEKQVRLYAQECQYSHLSIYSSA